MMVAARIFLPLVLWAVAQPVAGASAEEEVVELLKADVVAKVDQLQKVSRRCEQAKRQGQVSLENLAALALSREQLIAAVGYLSLRNDYLCTQQARRELSFALAAFESVRQDYDYPPSESGLVQQELLYPSARYYELGVHYARLPSEAREQAQAVVGSRPFELMPVLNAIPPPD
ncbi:hypothetical protein [Alkalilimnicola sp. S0819]|uniref:hypothetical protein n=1 Tax=Alkalilimnicola sp. S0819 TaxID=2613922 RepID=UPI0012622840|nr:hypothetical protein [Alkalilimnicola sp. S0819]KAB7627279.1 hypothetical protein F3N43_05025 [Alkalilimnicola sp. S0819]MPQ15992.1 hypothetical protein [Alkalilimnicola sp. S0819]